MSSSIINRLLNSITKGCFTITVVLFLCMAGSCSKNGTAVRESFQTDFHFLAVSQDPMQLGIKIDDEIKVTDLIAPADDPKTVTINYFDKKKKITIYDVADGEVLFDSILTVNTSSVSLSLFQSASGAPFRLVLPPADITPPPDGDVKISIVYTFPDLPEEVKVVVENKEMNGANYLPTDSFFLQKGGFSRYFLVRNGSGKPVLKIYTPTATRKLLGEVSAGQFSTLSTPYSIYAIRKDRPIGTGIFDLLAQKLY